MSDVFSSPKLPLSAIAGLFVLLVAGGGCDSSAASGHPPGNQAPEAAFSFSPAEPEAGQEVQFDASASEDPDGEIVSYAWDFDGDGATDEEGAAVSKTFEETATVTLTVTDAAGAEGTAEQEVAVDAAGVPANGPDLDVVGEARVTVHTGRERAPISPYVYGSNQDLPGGNVWTVRRLGGNRLTGYNWETNDSNAGSDYQQSSDNYLLYRTDLPEAQWDEPARVATYFHDQSLDLGAESIITLQMAGYVAADDEGTVTEAETAPSERWHEVVYNKDGLLQPSPDLSDDAVYMDEFVHALTAQYGGAASASGIRWYSLDNEPALWPDTHPRIHPEQTGAQELVDRSMALASAVKAVDVDASILGPALYGFGAFHTLNDAPDWPEVGSGYDWFVGYYLDQMRQAEQEAGRRLIDALDVHWYPEARGDHRIVFAPNANTPADVEARLQAPRSLWDSTYTGGAGYIGEYFSEYLPIIPRLQQSIEDRYPGTDLSFSEYQYGAKDAISGGLAQADVLGVFGAEGVDVATLWGIEEGDAYAAAAFDLYRNYDGQGSTYGDTHVRAATNDRSNVSVWAAIEDEDEAALHVILINKNREGAMNIEFSIESGATYTAGEAWSFDAEAADITENEEAVEQISEDNRFAYVVPGLSATHIVLRP